MAKRRNPNVQFTLTDTEYERAIKIAFADGRTVPNWAKFVTVTALKKNKKNSRVRL